MILHSGMAKFLIIIAKLELATRYVSREGEYKFKIFSSVELSSTHPIALSTT